MKRASLRQLRRNSALQRGAVALAVSSAPIGFSGTAWGQATTGTIEGRFGVGIDEAREWFAQSARLTNVRLDGLHVHIGSQMLRLGPIQLALQRVAAFWRELVSSGHTINSIGGGLGVRYREGRDQPVCIKAYAEVIRKALPGFGGRILLEPGRWLVAEAARFLLISLVLMLCGTDARAAAPKTSSPVDYSGLVDAVVAQYHLPGIAVGVIDDGKVVYARTMGKLESGKPIDTDTLFEIASNSKAMTATLLARLVEEGKLHWDDPVTRYLPSFRMYDPWVTANMQVGDLLVHHSGLPEGAGDLMLWPEPNQFTPEDVLRGLRYLKPAYSFRAGYAYDNTLYIVAGLVAAAAGGAPYPTLMRREVFRPLGMNRCQIGTWNRDEVGNVARPHIWRDGSFVQVPTSGPVVHAATMDAAGGVHCSLNDMLIWAMNWLAPTPQQLAWLSPQQRQREWTGYTPMPISADRHAWDGTLFYSYGYGWRIADVDGQMTVSHTGTLSGMYSAVTLLPFRKSGYVFLIDADAENARIVLNEVLTKRFTAPEKARSVASYAEELAREDRQQGASRVPDTSSRKPATPLELVDQLGVWRDPWFGEVRICARGNAVFFASQKSPRLAGQVMRVGEHYLVHWGSDNSEAWLLFPRQAGDALHMAKVDPDADFSDDYEDLTFKREHACK